MFNIGPQELLVILLVALVVVGPKRLPELSRTIGRGLREFRKAQNEVTKTIRLGLDEIEPTGSSPSSARSSGAATAPDGSGAEEGSATAGSEEDVADVARTLGRGLAEIRRARREVQRAFRIDPSDEAVTRRPRPRPTPTSGEATPGDGRASVPTERGPAGVDRAPDDPIGAPGDDPGTGEGPVEPEAAG